MTGRHLTKLCLAILLWLPSFASTAIETHLMGFGTASLSCFSSDEADFVPNDFPKGPGNSGRCDTGLDSLLGLQADITFTESLEFGIQAITARTQDRDYRPEISVAQLRWRPTDTTTLRLGRMPTPTFLHSEDRQVRYAMPWVRPPQEVYSLLPSFSTDGLEIIYETQIGNWQTEWQGGITTIEFDTLNSTSQDAFPVESDNIYLNLMLRNINTMFKLGYYHGVVTLDNPDLELLLGLLSTFGGSPGRQLADDLEIDKTTGHLISAGIRHEQNNWLAVAEIAFRQTNGFIRDQYGAYITVGHRFNSWMPYMTIAKRWTKGPETDSRAGLFTAQVEDLLAISRFDSKSASVGLAKDLTESSTLKLQVDWIKPDDDSWGLYFNHSPTYDYANPEEDWLFTLSVDFIF